MVTVTVVDVEAFVATDEGRQWLSPKLDQAVTKGINTYKEKTLPGLVEDAIRVAHPAETPEQKRLRTLETDLAQERKFRNREVMKSKIISQFAADGISTEIADFIVADDEESTNANVLKIKDIWKTSLTKEVTKQLGVTGRQPQNNTLDAATIDAQIKIATENRNVTEMIRLKNLKHRIG